MHQFVSVSTEALDKGANGLLEEVRGTTDAEDPILLEMSSVEEEGDGEAKIVPVLIPAAKAEGK